MNNKNTLFLVRGLPGSGKSSLARFFGTGFHLEADAYFDLYNGGEFDHEKLADAHHWCWQSTENLMVSNQPEIYVSNTFTQEWEMKRYFELADRFAYQVVTIIVENRHGSESVHNVPAKTLEKMKERFEVVL